jgi:hypothetical protein
MHSDAGREGGAAETRKGGLRNAEAGSCGNWQYRTAQHGLVR